jgi:hypothetical protein
VFRQASFLERSLVERFDPEGFANRPEGEWRSSEISGAPEIGAGQRVTDVEFAPVAVIVKHFNAAGSEGRSGNSQWQTSPAGIGLSAMSRRDREVPKGSGGSRTDGAF